MRHARRLNGRQWTFQVETCGTGGGHTWNHRHQYFDGQGQMLEYRADHMIGWKWASAVKQGTVSASLNFQVNVGVVTIGGSTNVANYGTHSGTTGKDPNVSWPKRWRKYNANRINEFYMSPHTFKFNGTGSEEGNVGHSLYEFNTAGTVNFTYGASPTILALCAALLDNCPKFN